jgi:hypothetical protein
LLLPAAAGALKGPLGLVGQHLVDPDVNLARLHAELFGQLAHCLLARQMPADDLGLLLRRKKCLRVWDMETSGSG